MLFDTFCKIAEISGDADLRRAAREAALFDLPYVPHEILPHSIPQEERDFLRESFFLPFPVTAVEDKASLCILFDLVKDQSGLETERGFFDLLSMGVSLKNFRQGNEVPEVGDKNLGMPNKYILSQGIVQIKDIDGTKQMCGGGIQKLLFYDSDTGEVQNAGELFKDDPQVSKRITEGEITNAKTAIEEVMFCNTPERFIVQVTPRNVRPANSKKIPRSHERSRYLLLKPGEIRQTFRVSDETDSERSSPSPHCRRKHWRFLRSEKFKKMRGKTIVIPASWVGPSESEVNGRRYRVMLDL